MRDERFCYNHSEYEVPKDSCSQCYNLNRISDLEQELQKAREQLKKAESVLKVSVDINVSGWETYRMANQYFKEKDK